MIQVPVEKVPRFDLFQLSFLSNFFQSDEDLTAISEEIIEKLKLLNYEKEFLSHKYIPIVRPAHLLGVTNHCQNLTLLSNLTLMSNSPILLRKIYYKYHHL